MNTRHYLKCLLLCCGVAFAACRPGQPSQSADTPSAPDTAENTAAVSAGETRKLTDITLPDADGKSHSLLEEVGKAPLTLIDFWASWCGPCMQEMPHVKDIYAQHRDRGFQIIGISLDNDRDAWQQTIGNNHLDWLHLSDLKGWESLAAQTFGIEAIPFTMLVNADGDIIATDLRGEALAQAVAQHLPTPTQQEQ